MNVVDKVLTEWAYRCKKGYPDINNPDDMKVLRELYSEYGIVMEEEKPPINYDEEISKLLTSLSDQKGKEAIYKYLIKLNKDEDKSDEQVDKEIEDLLLGKKVVKQYAEYTTLLASKYKISDDLLEYLQHPKLTLQDLEQENNLTTLFTKSELPSKFLQKLTQVTGKGIGKGELALICLIKDCENMGGKVGETQGDIKIGSKSVEMKMGAGQLVPHHISGYSSKPVKELNSIFGDEYNFTERAQWVALVQRYYNAIQDKDDFLVKVNKMLKDFYSNYVPPITKDILQGKGLSRHIMDSLAQKYIGEGKDVMLIDERNYSYVFIANYDDYLTLADAGKFAVAYPDKLPRILYRAT